MSTHEVHPYRIEGMTCAACAARIEKVLNRQSGVVASVSFATGLAMISGLDAADVEAAVSRAGYIARPAPDLLEEADTASSEAPLWPVLLGLTLALPFGWDMLAMSAGWHTLMLPPWLAAGLASLIQFSFGLRFYQGAWHALKSGGANMDTLVALGTSAAWGYSLAVTVGLLPGHVYFEASVFVIALVWFGKWLESRARAGTQGALLALARLQPKTARVETEGGWVSRDVRLLRVGDVVRVEPGEAFPADGEVLSGETAVDESMLTGEAMPIDKAAGDLVYAGTLNRQGAVRCRVNQAALESQLARIIALVRDAQASKAPIQSLADRVSGIFVPSVLGIAMLTFVGWWAYGAGLETALVNAVAVLVIACPCALGLATPTAIVVGTGVAARHGILIRHAGAMEAAAQLKWLALDKTGTLTEGRPSVVYADFGTATAWVQAAAAGSRHPLAQALSEALVRDHTIQVDRLTQILGEGLEAELNDGTARHILRLGRPEWVGATGLPAVPPDASVVAASLDGRPIGHAVLADRLRPDAAAALAALRAQGITPVLLTGDRAEAAAAVAQHLGIERWLGGCLPADKASAITQLKADGPTGMAGDGLNDAPALALADVSLAIGQGAEAAIAAADLTLARSDAMAIADALAIARATLRVIRQNLGFAFVYNLVGIPAAALGHLHPAIAGAAMAASSVSVLLNALRLRRWRPHTSSTPSGAR